MLVTRQKILRRFWYPIVPSDRADRRARCPSPCSARTGAVPRWRRPCVGAERSLLPSHRRAEQGLGRRPATSSAPITAGPTPPTASACAFRSGPTATRQEHAVEAFPCAERYGVRLGGARGAAGADPRLAGGERSRLSPHRPVLRAVGLRRFPADGEQLRQRAHPLRASQHVRRHQRSRSAAAHHRALRLRLRRALRRAGLQHRGAEAEPARRQRPSPSAT